VALVVVWLLLVQKSDFRKNLKILIISERMKEKKGKERAREEQVFILEEHRAGP